MALLLAVSASVVGALLLTGGQSHSAQAQASFAVLKRPLPNATAPLDDPILSALHGHNPKLELAAARVLLADSVGTIWLASSTDGGLCLVEKVAQPDSKSGVTSRFSCQDATAVAKRGMVAGVPGEWYGLVPDGAGPVYASVGGQSIAVDVSNGAFRLPEQASSVTLPGSAPEALPQALPSGP